MKETSTAETWRPIPGFEGFWSASSEGRIRRDYEIAISNGLPRGAGYIKKLPTDGRYQITRLSRGDGKMVCRRVHILVALAFLGPKPTPLHHVNHKNGDKLDNRVVNLEYATRRENEDHAVAHQLHPWGERHAAHKLTAEQVYAIRASREKQSVLTARYGISRTTVQAIKHRRTWRHLPEAA